MRRKTNKNRSVNLSASVLVVRKSKMLLIAEKIDGQIFYCEPVGGVESDEPMQKAAIREVAEETGYRVRLVGLVGIYHILHQKGRENNALRFVFEGKIIGRKKNWKPETNIKPFWVNIKDMPNYFSKITRPASRRALRNYLENRRGKKRSANLPIYKILR